MAVTRNQSHLLAVALAFMMVTGGCDGDGATATTISTTSSTTVPVTTTTFPSELPPPEDWPLPITEPCPITSDAQCFTEFEMAGVIYGVRCSSLRPDVVVSDDMVGVGLITRASPDRKGVYRIEGVDPREMVAMMLPTLACGEDSPVSYQEGEPSWRVWSALDTDWLSDLWCQIADISDAERAQLQREYDACW